MCCLSPTTVISKALKNVTGFYDDGVIEMRKRFRWYGRRPGGAEG
jgi:hypothetical protein